VCPMEMTRSNSEDLFIGSSHMYHGYQNRAQADQPRVPNPLGSNSISEACYNSHTTSRIRGIGSKQEEIHLAAGTDDQVYLHAAVSHILERGLSIDTRDTQGKSALEIAILAGLCKNVEVLLSSITTLDCQNRTVERSLEFAVRSRADHTIIHLLLRQGANPWRQVVVGNRSLSLLWCAAECEATLDPIRLQNYLRTVYILIKNNVRGIPKDTAQEIFGIVLATINRTSYSMNELLTLVRKMLHLFLVDYACDPLHKQPIAFCPDGTCKNLAASILFHAPDLNLSAVLYHDAVLSKHGSALLYTLIKPCGHLRLSPGSSELDDFLLYLVRWDNGSGPVTSVHPDRNPMCHILMNPMPGMLKRSFATILISSGHFGLHRSDSIFGLPMAALAGIEECLLRYELACIMLQSELESWYTIDSSPYPPPTLLKYNTWHSYIMYFEPDYTREVGAYLHSENSTAAEVRIVMYCIYHVVTKHMIEQASWRHCVGDNILTRQLLIDAFLFRMMYNLPAITMDYRTVYELLINDGIRGLLTFNGWSGNPNLIQ